MACDSASCALVTRGQGGLLAKGAFRTDISYRYTDESVPLEGSHTIAEVIRPKVFLELGEILPGVHREIAGRESFLQVDFGYGVTSHTTLLASVPLLADRSFTIAHFGTQADYNTQSVGDILVGAKQGLWRSLVGGLALKLPSGDSQRTGDYNGSILDPTLQPGSGSWDVVSSLQCSGRITDWRLDWTLVGSYQINTTNTLGYRFGNLGLVAAGAQRNLIGPLSGSLQVKFVEEARSVFLGQGVPSTGSRTGYLNPGLSVRLPTQTAIYGVVQFVPFRYVNEEQLAPRIAFLFGVSKTFTR